MFSWLREILGIEEDEVLTQEEKEVFEKLAQKEAEERRIKYEQGEPALVGLSYDTGAYLCRFIDREAGVACWVSSSGTACLPLSETNLD